MIPGSVLKELIMTDIVTVNNYRALLEIFCILLHDQGMSYQRMRQRWLKYKKDQLALFSKNAHEIVQKG